MTDGKAIAEVRDCCHEFEAFCRKQFDFSDADFAVDDDGDYEDIVVQRTWDAWLEAWDNRTRKYRPATAPRPAPEGTVRVRAACLVVDEGEWLLMGSSVDRSDEEMREVIVDMYLPGSLDGTERISFITADVPLPSPPVEVRGEVEA